jgi:mono/diheme cytochrome c family protein
MSDLFAPRSLAAGAALAVFTWLTAAPTPAQSPAATPDGYPAVRTQLTELCGRCHGEKASKGGVNLAPFADGSAVLRERKLWRAVAEQLKSGEMPPEGAKQPSAAQRAAIVAWITARLDAADEQDRRRPDPGRSVVRRLNRYEYNRTVRDLLGVELDAAGAVGMSDDVVGESFDNLAAALTVTDGLVEKYVAAAGLILDAFYATAPRERKKYGAPTSPFERLVSTYTRGEFAPQAAARIVVEPLARRAYRRRVEPRELDRLLTLYDRELAAGATPEAALRPVLKALLVSPNFLLRVEKDKPDEPGVASRVTGHEIAVRLSYFLWSSMPDAELFAAADRGELGTPAGVEAQAKRMLADPKAKALTESFAEQWLQLRKLPDARPSVEFFPSFTASLRRAMHDEAALFFDHLRTENRSVLEVVDADYTFVNDELARHYGMAKISGQEMRKVQHTDPARGGLLGMGAVLAVTSHTSRTSPTLRGKYVLDVVLGTPPPPPPPNVGQIDEGKKGREAKTFRELLAQHATQPACAGCHAKIDPLGFGLETFDAVGRTRKAGPDVDASGTLPGGEAFTGPKELRQVLLRRKDRVAENLTEKLLAYALGRELQAPDAAAVRAITADLAKDGYRFSTLVLGVVRSYPFQHRRNARGEE